MRIRALCGATLLASACSGAAAAVAVEPDGLALERAWRMAHGPAIARDDATLLVVLAANHDDN